MGSIRRIGVAGLVLASLSCLVAAMPASAAVASSSVAPAFTVLPAPGRVTYGAVTIGDRYVVYESLSPGQMRVSAPGTPHTLSITDTLAMTTRQVTLPTGCYHWAFQSLRDRFLVGCSEEPSGTFIYDPATATVVAGPLVFPRGVSGAGFGIGDQWAAGASISSEKPAERLRAYYNWHTGKVRWLPILKHPDLDDPKLRTAVNCAPFGGLARMPAFYGQPNPSYLFSAPQDGRTAYVLKGKGSRKAVYAGRCVGGGRLTKVHEINRSTIDPGSITNGWSAWASRSGCQLNSYDDVTHHIYKWTTWPAGHPCVDLIGKTRYAIVSSAPDGTVERPFYDGKGDPGPIATYQLSIAPRPQ